MRAERVSRSTEERDLSSEHVLHLEVVTLAHELEEAGFLPHVHDQRHFLVSQRLRILRVRLLVSQSHDLTLETTKTVHNVLEESPLHVLDFGVIVESGLNHQVAPLQDFDAELCRCVHQLMLCIQEVNRMRRGLVRLGGSQYWF